MTGSTLQRLACGWLTAALLTSFATAALPARALPPRGLPPLAGPDDVDSMPETESPRHLSQFGGGSGPSQVDGVYRLLDREQSPGQSNAIAFDVEHAGGRQSMKLSGELRVNRGGDGGAFVFLNANEYGSRGPAPFVRSWVEPNLRGTFAVAIDVHNPKNEEMFGEWGNYQGLPQREVSIHFDGRELVKRVAPVEFRGEWAGFEITVEHVSSGAEVSVMVGDAVVYDREFVAELTPYEARLAMGAGTRSDLATDFDVRKVEFSCGDVAGRTRAPVHVEVFNHVLTNNSKTSFQETVTLPPAEFAFGRVLLTLDIHDAGPDWDEWDRNGHLYLVQEDGSKWDIVPFITSYRTECHWVVDVTRFRPWLAGQTTLEIHAGTGFYKNRGFMMSVSLEFHHGSPEVVPSQVIPLWHGRAGYGSDENHFQGFFEPQRIDIPEGTVAAQIATTTTGHSQIGEFTPSDRTLVFAPRVGDDVEHRFPNTLWKSDCYLNPNRPQFGTWKFSRAGWAPGDVVRPWKVDVSPHLEAGTRCEIRYESSPYRFPEGARPKTGQINKAGHVVRSFLILYRAGADLVPAPTLVVASVEKNSNAGKAGVKKGDYLASYDGLIVDTTDELRSAKQVATDAGKESVEIIVYRGAARIAMSVSPGQLGVQLAGG